MTGAATLLLLTTLAASSPASPETVPAISVSREAGGQQAQPDPTPQPTDAPHRLGLGGSMGFGNRGGGGGFRLFANNHLGLDMNIGWYRGTIGSSSGSGGSTFVVSPSVIYMFRRPNAQANVDLRPYVGGGLNYSRRTLGDQVRTSPTTSLNQNGRGGQVFGGVEMTFAEAKAVAVSAEIAHYEMAASTGFTAGRARGTDAYLMFHFYVN